MAKRGDKYSRSRLKEMQSLDNCTGDKFTASYSLTEIIERAKRKERFQKMLIPLPFPNYKVEVKS
jgi:hypothetical protein